MIRTKPPSDVYRDGWDRVFGEEPQQRPSWPTEHESDCPVKPDGTGCRCPMGNL